MAGQIYRIDDHLRVQLAQCGGQIAPHIDRSWHASFYNCKICVPVRGSDQCINRYPDVDVAIKLPNLEKRWDVVVNSTRPADLLRRWSLTRFRYSRQDTP